MREKLRQATGEIHARLDERVGHLPMAAKTDYSTFLAAQYRSRLAMEAAFALQPPPGIEAPPQQSGLIAKDLREMGALCPAPSEAVQLTTPHAALGAAWAIAGSSLGNSAILVRRRKAGLSGSDRFLSDTSMRTYFSQLLPVLSQPFETAQIEEAVEGAKATFALFETCFADTDVEFVV